MTVNVKKSRLAVQGTGQADSADKLSRSSLLKEGLPAGAFAAVIDPGDPGTWLAPHHTASPGNNTGQAGKVDWEKIEECVRLLSRQGLEGRRLNASPEIILTIAHHLAGHYISAGRPLPDALAVLV